MNGTEAGDCEERVVIIGVGRVSVANKIKFAINTGMGDMRGEGFGSQGEMEDINRWSDAA